MISAKSIAARIEVAGARDRGGVRRHRQAGGRGPVCAAPSCSSPIWCARSTCRSRSNFLEAVRATAMPWASSREVRILKDLRGEIAGRDVLVVGGYRRHRPHADPCGGAAEIARAGAAEDHRAARQAVAARGRQSPPTGSVSRSRMNSSRRLRHRLRAAQPQPAPFHRQGAHDGRGCRLMPPFLLRMMLWVRNPPLAQPKQIAIAVICGIGVAFAAIEWFVGWPELADRRARAARPALHGTLRQAARADPDSPVLRCRSRNGQLTPQPVPLRSSARIFQNRHRPPPTGSLPQ